MSEKVKAHEGIGPAPLLRDVLVRAHLKPGRAISPDIHQIDLGIFADEARTIANVCFMDKDHSNLLKPIYATGSGKILVPNNPYMGTDPNFVWTPIIGSNVPKETAIANNLDEKYLAMLLQTASNTDLAISPSAHTYLLLQDSVSYALSSTLIAGRTKNMVTFRGENTPQLTESEASKKMKLWEWQLKERISAHVKPGMSIQEAEHIADTAMRALFKQIVKTYDLVYFVGDSEQDIVTRQDPESI